LCTGLNGDTNSLAYAAEFSAKHDLVVLRKDKIKPEELQYNIKLLFRMIIIEKRFYALSSLQQVHFRNFSSSFFEEHFT
jgi:hypothetical protein